MAATPATVHDEPATTLPPPKARLSFWTLFWAGLGFALLLLVVGLVSYWIFGGAEERFVDADAKRVEYRTKVYNDRVTEDTKYLRDQASWFDKGKGLVRVPIQEAIKMTIPKLQSEKPHPAYPLSKSPPQPAAAPTSPALPTAAGNNAVNPPASNPTVAQPAPGPVTAPAPQAAAAASSPVPVAPATQTPVPSPAPAAVAPAPAPTADPAGSTPAPTPQ